MDVPTDRRPPNSLLHNSWHYGGIVPKFTGHSFEYRACNHLENPEQVLEYDDFTTRTDLAYHRNLKTSWSSLLQIPPLGYSTATRWDKSVEFFHEGVQSIGAKMHEIQRHDGSGNVRPDPNIVGMSHSGILSGEANNVDLPRAAARLSCNTSC